MIYQSWLTRRCSGCKALGKHAVVFQRPRCEECRAADRAFGKAARDAWFGSPPRPVPQPRWRPQEGAF